MPNEHRADPTPPPHHGQGRGGSKEESFSLRVSPALHPPERPFPRHADMADYGLGRETRERRLYIRLLLLAACACQSSKMLPLRSSAELHSVSAYNVSQKYSIIVTTLNYYYFIAKCEAKKNIES